MRQEDLHYSSESWLLILAPGFRAWPVSIGKVERRYHGAHKVIGMQRGEWILFRLKCICNALFMHRQTDAPTAFKVGEFTYCTT